MLSSLKRGIQLLFDWHLFKDIQGSQVNKIQSEKFLGPLLEIMVYLCPFQKEFTMAGYYLTHFYYSTLSTSQHSKLSSFEVLTPSLWEIEPNVNWRAKY